MSTIRNYQKLIQSLVINDFRNLTIDKYKNIKENTNHNEVIDCTKESFENIYKKIEIGMIGLHRIARNGSYIGQSPNTCSIVTYEKTYELNEIKAIYFNKTVTFVIQIGHNCDILFDNKITIIGDSTNLLSCTINKCNDEHDNIIIDGVINENKITFPIITLENAIPLVAIPCDDLYYIITFKNVDNNFLNSNLKINVNETFGFANNPIRLEIGTNPIALPYANVAFGGIIKK